MCQFIFFLQAEDGIRDWSVTGVQTCALPIYIKTKRKFTRTITAECTENQKEKKIVFFQLFAKKGHPPTGEIKR